MEGSPAHRFFDSLPAELQQPLRQAGRVRRYADGCLIHARGSRDRAFSIIEAGRVRTSNVSRDGRKIDSAILEAGDSFGEFTLFAGSPRFYDFEAVGETSIRQISAEEFQRILDASPALRDAIISMLAQRLLLAVELLEDLRQLPLAARLAKALLRLSEESDGQHSYSRSQSTLAQSLGVSRVALGQALEELKAAGLIETRYRRIVITDFSALCDWLRQHSPLLPLDID